jgi:hypothetical protein
VAAVAIAGAGAISQTPRRKEKLYKADDMAYAFLKLFL